MKTTQAWGWLTAGVLALGLNGIYHDGGTRWAHRMLSEAAFRANAALEPLSGQVDGFMSNLEMVAAPSEARKCRRSTVVERTETTAARTQGRMARIEAMSAIEGAQLARLEANRARIEAQAARAQFAAMTLEPMDFNAREVRINCPRVRVVIPQLPIIKEPVSVNVATAGPGPI